MLRWGESRGGELSEQVKGWRCTDWQLQNSHKDVKYSIRDIVNNICNDCVRWVLEILDGILCTLATVLST